MAYIGMVYTLNLWILFLFCLIVHQSCNDSVYRYPLADTTGTAEVVYGGLSGYEGLGFVTTFTPHPSLPYNSLYFDGIPSANVELTLGTQYTVDSDWSFVMYVYSYAPHQGTIFDFMYDGSLPQSNSLFTNRIKLELAGSNMILTMEGPSGEDYGSATLGSFITAEAWIAVGVVHDRSNGDTIVMTKDNEFWKSKDHQNNQNDVLLPQPAKIRIGGAYGVPSPFKGSVTCFALYAEKFSKGSFDQTLDECDPSNWPVIPATIDLSTLTTTTSITPTTSTTTATSTTATSTPTSPTTTTTVPTTSTTTTTEQTTTTITTTTPLPSTTSTTIQTTLTTAPNPCPECSGYFAVVGKHIKPLPADLLIIVQASSSNRQCAQLCLTFLNCQSFTYNKTTFTCVLYSFIYYSNTVPDTGTHYYRNTGYA